MESKMDWNEIFLRLHIDTSKVFGKGNIPEKKIANVLGSYAKDIKKEDIILLVDDTVFGGAKDGLILAAQGLFSHRPFEEPYFIEITKIDRINSMGRDILVNNEKFCKLDTLDKKMIPGLCSLLMELVTMLRSDNHPEITQDVRMERTNRTLISDKIKEVLDNSSFSSNRIFIHPDIPYSKSANAVDTYAKNVKVDEIILLYDDTAFGGAKDGFIITSDKIYAHQFLMEPVSININEIDYITISDHDFLINGEKKFSASLLDDDNINEVKYFVEKICELNNKDAPQNDKLENQLISELCESTAFYFLSLIGNTSDYRELFFPEPMAFKIANRISLNNKYSYNKGLRKALVQPDDTIDSTTQAILLYTFNYQRLISPCPDSAIEFLFMTDSIIHELLIFLTYKGNSIIYLAFDDEAHRMAALSIFTEDIMYKKILLPFYKFVISNRPKPTSLRETAQFRDLPEIFKGVLNNRTIYNNYNPMTQPLYIRKFIMDSLTCDHLSFNISRLLSTDNSSQCNPHSSKLISAAYVVAHRLTIKGVLDQFLETFVSDSEAFLEKTLVTLFNE